jgi:hypothetical protein
MTRPCSKRLNFSIQVNLVGVSRYTKFRAKIRRSFFPKTWDLLQGSYENKHNIHWFGTAISSTIEQSSYSAMLNIAESVPSGSGSAQRFRNWSSLESVEIPSNFGIRNIIIILLSLIDLNIIRIRWAIPESHGIARNRMYSPTILKWDDWYLNHS